MNNILISNDDGIYAEGIQVLAETLHNAGYEVLVVAPDRDRSGSGHSMTMDRPLKIQRIAHRMLSGNYTAYSCDGTPTDSVIMGIEVLHFPPDIVLSGINCGPNLGDDLTYSGTACAAMEGLIFGHPSMAVSLVCSSKAPEKHFETAAAAALEIIRWVEGHPMSENVMYNVNVPNVPIERLNGVKITRKGIRRYVDKITVVKDPFGGEAYWVGGRIEDDLREETDLWAVANNYVSITPIHMEMTSFYHYNAAKETPMESEVFKRMKREKSVPSPDTEE